eukprot:scaffold130545_cov114-Phaeocystis_antarctica.AAC.5
MENSREPPEPLSSVGQSTRTGSARERRTRLLEDQLGRADAGSWQIADGGATRKAAADGTSVGDFRVHFAVASGFMSLREFTGKSMKSCTYEIGKVVV